MSRWLRGLVFGCLALASVDVFATGQVVTIFDANGKIVSGVTPNGTTSSLFNVENGTWGAPSSPNNAARVVLERDLALGAQEGASVAGKLPVAVATEFAAIDLAGAAVRLARGGLVGLVVGAALDLALKKASLSFDSLQQSMVYNPPVIPAGPQPVVEWVGQGNSGQLYGDPGSAVLEYCNEVAHDKCAITGVTYSYGPDGVTPVSAQVRFTYSNGNPSQIGVPTRVVVMPGLDHCPNGVTFNNVTQCKQAVTDLAAQGYLSGQIDASNGPAIGQNAMGGNGIQVIPQGGVTNSPNSLPYDPASWPQTSGPQTTTYGPQTTTSTSSGTTIGGNGQPVTTTTTNTTSLTTNITNNYQGNTVTSNVTNTQHVQSCDAMGVCTNTTNTSTPANSQTPDDEKVKVCGLPNTPACKIDETGTQEAAQTGIAAQTAASSAFDTQLGKYTASGSGGGAGAVGIPGVADFVAPASHGAPTGLDAVIPDGSGSCTPLTTTWGSRPMVFDWCPLVNTVRPIMDWLGACLTAFTLWSIWVGRNRQPEGAA